MAVYQKYASTFSNESLVQIVSVVRCDWKGLVQWRCVMGIFGPFSVVS